MSITSGAVQRASQAGTDENSRSFGITPMATPSPSSATSTGPTALTLKPADTADALVPGAFRYRVDDNSRVLLRVRGGGLRLLYSKQF